MPPRASAACPPPGMMQTGTLAKSRLALLSWFCLLPTHLPPSLSLEPPTSTAPVGPGPGEALISGRGWREKRGISG